MLWIRTPSSFAITRCADVHHVDPTLAEEGILDAREHFLVGGQHFTDRQEPAPGASNALFELGDETLVLEDLDVRVEDGGEIRAEAFPDLVPHVVKLAPRVGDSIEKIAPLLLRIRVRGVVDVLQIDRVIEKVDRPDGDAAGCGNAAHLDISLGAGWLLGGGKANTRAAELRDDPLSHLFGTGHQGEELRVHHQRGDELGAGIEQLHVPRLELAGLAGLHDEHADREVSQTGRGTDDQRCRHQRGKPLLAGLGEVAIVGVGLRIHHRHGLAPLGRVTDQPFSEGEGHLPHRVPVETDGRSEHQVLEIGLRQVDRADVGVQALGDEIDDVVQSLVQVVGARDDSRDVRKQRVPVRNGTPLVGRPPKARPRYGTGSETRPRPPRGSAGGARSSPVW